MADRRSARVIAAAFFAGVAWAAVVVGPDLLAPPPEPYFDLEQPPVVAVAVEPSEPATPPPPVVVASTPPVPADPPERLALNATAAPIAAAIVPQALPTAGPSQTETPKLEMTPASLPADVKPVPELPAPPAIVEAAAPAEVTRPESMRALVARVQPEPAERPASDGAAPLPGAEWTDPDGVNWSDPPAAGEAGDRAPAEQRSGGRLLGRIMERRAEATGSAPAGPRLFERLRNERRGRGSHAAEESTADADARDGGGTRWPNPAGLVAQLEALSTADGAAASWASTTQASLQATLATRGPRDPASDEPLLTLGESVPAGMKLADETVDAVLASRIRRVALGVSRRVAVWRAAAALCTEVAGDRQAAAAGEIAADITAAGTVVAVAGVVAALERYEGARAAADAAAARESLRAVVASASDEAKPLHRAVHDHYLSPNLRIAINEQFVERMLPESTVSSGPLQDFVLGRRVRGVKTVEQSTAVVFVPNPAEIRLDLLVSGEIASRTVTDAGAVEIHSRGQSTFTVQKPIHVSPQGLVFNAARGTASSQTQLANIQTSFDSVPLVGPLVRGIARSQHDEMRDEADREVRAKIVGRACREVDQQTEPKLTELADRIRERFWKPMAQLGLEPAAVALETTADAATARLRLAATEQLAAHTPRPRAPADALMSMQIHESSVNNACGRFGLAGRKLSLEELTRFVCERLGIPPQVPDDLPEGVEVTFAATEPLRIECRDGLVHVRVALDALESGRRNNWYDIVANVAYRPVASGIQVELQREGPVQLSGDGQKGRMEFGLRTIFGKMFPKERPVPLVPAGVASNPRLAGVIAVQAVSSDGWLAFALGEPAPAGSGKTSATATRIPDPANRVLRR
jgi:hypothetical protein